MDFFSFFKNFKKEKKRIYMDYASTTPVSPEVFSAMQPYFESQFYNPSSLYKEGVVIKKVVEAARKQIAGYINCSSDDIIFTASGTESDNLALLGVFRAAKLKGITTPHIITTEIEHPAVLEVCKQIEKEGGEVTYLSVNKNGNENGLVSLDTVKKALKDTTVLISIIYVNNEIGVIQPIKEIARACYAKASYSPRHAYFPAGKLLCSRRRAAQGLVKQLAFTSLCFSI